MSYYILPKNNACLVLNYTIKPYETVPIYTSFSIYNYYNIIYKQLENFLLQISPEFFFEIFDTHVNEINSGIIKQKIKDFHTYEYIHSNVPGMKCSVSKLKTRSSFFYEFFETLVTLNCFEQFNYPIHFFHMGENYLDSINCFEMLRPGYNDVILYKNDGEVIGENIEKCDFLFYEINDIFFDDLNSYILQMINIVMIIITTQKENGISIIKVNKIFHKPIIDILYILSSMFEKVIILKPNVTNSSSFNKYLVCKSFICDNKEKQYNEYFHKLYKLRSEFTRNMNIHSIIDDEIPCYFINKIDDVNIIIGQQQLEHICQIITIFKNTNKNEKIDLIKKNNIQKSISWCEKFKIPCNKFLDKTNIFY